MTVHQISSNYPVGCVCIRLYRVFMQIYTWYPCWLFQCALRFH